MRTRSSLLCAALAATSAFGAKPEASASTHGLSFLGAWPHDILVVDEQKEQVVDRIDIGTDVPMELMLSPDHSKIYAFTVRDSEIVTVDVQTHKVLDHFKLDEGTMKYRLAAGAVDNDGKFMYTIVRATEKKQDRFSLDVPKFLVIDLVQHKIVRSVDFPKDTDAYGLGGLYVEYALRLSPDSKFLYMFRSDNILIFSTAEFKEVDRIELAKPMFPGLQSVSLNLGNDADRYPGFVTSVFVAADPVVHRPVFGIARMNLNTREIDFKPVGPYTNRIMNLWVTPDRTKGYTVSITGSEGNKRSEFWVFDMKTNQLIRKSEFPGRRRFDVALSPNGKSLYIYVAGYQIECYDPDTLKLTKTIDLNADSTSNMVMVSNAADNSPADGTISRPAVDH
jgi:DNA-binding beta-propeller fold protein YncE